MQNKANGRSAFIIIAAGLLALTTVPARACDTSDCGRIVLAQNADPQAQQEQQAQTDAAAAPEPNAETNKASKKTRHTKTSSRPEKAVEKSDKLATKTSASEKKSPDKMFGADKTADQGASNPTKFDDGKSSVSPWIANANAQMGPAPTAAATIAQDAVKSLTANATSTDGAQPMTSMATGTAAPATPRAAAVDPAPATDDDSQVVASDQLNDLDRAAEADQKSASKVLRPTSTTGQAASASSDDAWSQTSLIGKIFIGFGGLLTLASAARMFIA